jgi:DNA-directed RNA polymerase subunit E'/Rpb7
MSKLKSPYFNATLKTRITILPHQLDSNIERHIYENLIKQVESKCNNDGYIIKINEIKKDDDDGGVIDFDTFMASVNYNISYSCQFCSPEIKTEIVCRVEQIVEGFIRAVNGPLLCIISLTRSMNKIKMLDNDRNSILYDGKKISRGDLIKVNVISKVIRKDNTIIVILCELKGLASNDEKQIYDNDIQLFTKHGAVKNDLNKNFI